MFDILVATVILKDNKVLMVKETKEDVKGLLNFPAGHLEYGETIIEGAIREIKEETGLDAKITAFISNQYFTRKDKHYIAFVFKGEIINSNKCSINELAFDFYDINFLKENKHLLRNEKLIIPALNKLNQEDNNPINILNSKQ